MRRMFRVTNYRVNANKNHNEVFITPSQLHCHAKLTKVKGLECSKMVFSIKNVIPRMDM